MEGLRARKVFRSASRPSIHSPFSASFVVKILHPKAQEQLRLMQYCACVVCMIIGLVGTMGCQRQLRLPPSLSYRGPTEGLSEDEFEIPTAERGRRRLIPLREAGIPDDALLSADGEESPRLAKRLRTRVEEMGEGEGPLVSRLKQRGDSEEPGLLQRAASGTPLLVKEVSSDGTTSRLIRRGTPAATKGEIPPPKANLFGKVPSNDKDWVPELKVLPRAEFGRDTVTIHNVRNCEFLTYRDCLVDYYDKTYDLKKIQTVDFIVVPFQGNKAIAHTMVSFGFDGGDHVGISAEVRLSKGQAYDATMGLFGQFELTYVVADERDLIRSRTEHRDVDVYVYRSTATPEMARKLFVDMLQRANQLHDTPEFYDTLTNNCTTNIVRHINKLAPNKVPYDYRVLFPGYADRLAYELGLIDNSLPFAEVKRRARINDIALLYKDSPDFSAKIRGEKVTR